MSKLNPEKLSVEFTNGVTLTEPIIPRRYILTHSDTTARLFLTIGLRYSNKSTTPMRDEVYGEWTKKAECYVYKVHLYVDGKTERETAIRNYMFRRELPLALEAIRYGDQQLFYAHHELDKSTILIYFLSRNPKYSKIEDWGTFKDYDITIKKD